MVISEFLKIIFLKLRDNKKEKVNNIDLEKKYGNDYKKYCDLYIRMQKVEKDLLDYLKEIHKID